jgi:hypothetical protein
VQPDETVETAHYRLAQAYQRTGEKDKAQVEVELHHDIDMKLKDDIDHERHELQEFVISLQATDSRSQPHP